MFVIDENENVVVINLDTDVYMVKKEGRDIIFHTKNGAYKYIQTFLQAEKFLKSIGYERVDRGTMVNIKKVVNINTKTKTAEFDKKYLITISRDGMKKLKKSKEISHLFK